MNENTSVRGNDNKRRGFQKTEYGDFRCIYFLKVVGEKETRKPKKFAQSEKKETISREIPDAFS